MNQQAPVNSQTVKTIWIALTGSILIYGIVLFQIQKMQFIAFPEGDLDPFQMMALVMNFMILGTFFFFRKVVEKKSSIQEKFPLMVICWALNESVAIMGFAATFLNEDGNGIFYVINAAMAIFGNLLTFPRD